jgi:hypothetical protein
LQEKKIIAMDFLQFILLYGISFRSIGDDKVKVCIQRGHIFGIGVATGCLGTWFAQILHSNAPQNVPFLEHWVEQLTVWFHEPNLTNTFLLSIFVVLAAYGIRLSVTPLTLTLTTNKNKVVTDTDADITQKDDKSTHPTTPLTNDSMLESVMDAVDVLSGNGNEEETTKQKHQSGVDAENEEEDAKTLFDSVIGTRSKQKKIHLAPAKKKEQKQQ